MVVTQAKAPVTASRFLDYIHGPTRPVLVFDGATGTSLQDQGLTADDFGGPDLEGCNENLVITRPDAVQAVHRQFLDVGCDVIELHFEFALRCWVTQHAKKFSER